MKNAFKNRYQLNYDDDETKKLQGKFCYITKEDFRFEELDYGLHVNLASGGLRFCFRQ